MLYENVIQLCKERGISIAKLEREIGLGNATVRNWERSVPSVRTLSKVAEYFGVSMDDLLGNTISNEKSV